MNEQNQKIKEDKLMEEISKGKASSWFGVFLFLTIITVMIILVFLGFILMYFMNS